MADIPPLEELTRRLGEMDDEGEAVKKI